VANQCTKLEVFSLAVPEILVGQKFKMGHVTWPWPFQGQFVVLRLGLAMINLLNQFEVSMFTYYENMKGSTKCWILGDLGVKGQPRSSAMSPFDKAHTTSYSTLIEILRLSWPFPSYRSVILLEYVVARWHVDADASRCFRNHLHISPKIFTYPFIFIVHSWIVHWPRQCHCNRLNYYKKRNNKCHAYISSLKTIKTRMLLSPLSSGEPNSKGRPIYQNTILALRSSKQ